MDTDALYPSGIFQRYSDSCCGGSDADVVIIHPTKKRKVDWRKMQTNCDWSPYQGWSLAGFAEKTFSRGRQIVDDYKFTGENGWGQWLPRKKAGKL